MHIFTKITRCAYLVNVCVLRLADSLGESRRAEPRALPRMDDEERIGSRSFKEDPLRALNLLTGATAAQLNSDIEVGIHSCITLHADEIGACCKNVQILVIYCFLK